MLPQRWQGDYKDESEHYVNKVAKEKVALNEDERWLEAEIDEHINTPEEHYAHVKEMELIRNMMKQMRADHEEKIQSAKEERDKQVSDLKKQMSEIEERLKALNSDRDSSS